MNVQFLSDVWITGANSEVVFGSTLVPEDRYPTAFSIATIPGICIWARDKEAGRKIRANPRKSFVILIVPPLTESGAPRRSHATTHSNCDEELNPEDRDRNGKQLKTVRVFKRGIDNRSRMDKALRSGIGSDNVDMTNIVFLDQAGF
jgi:hypothetical protein